MAALDELRFGPERTLNLREALPTAAEAVRRCEGWLRSHQLRGTDEVLVITGRGSQSPGGIPVVKPAVEKLLFALRRRGVVAGHEEHNPGAFAVRLAPIRALTDAPPRRRDDRVASSAFAFEGLEPATLVLLRELSEHSLSALGVVPTPDQISVEMHRHLRVIAPGLAGEERIDAALQAALRAAIADYD